MTESDYIARIEAPGLGHIIITDLDSLLVARNLFEVVALRITNGKGKTSKKAKTKKSEKKIAEIKEEVTAPSPPPKPKTLSLPSINGVREKQIMKYLWEYPDSNSQDIAEEMKTNLPIIYPIVSKLSKEGMIIGEYMKGPEEKGKGKKHYAITEEGRKQYSLKDLHNDTDDFDEGDFK